MVDDVSVFKSLSRLNIKGNLWLSIIFRYHNKVEGHTCSFVISIYWAIWTIFLKHPSPHSSPEELPSLLSCLRVNHIHSWRTHPHLLPATQPVLSLDWEITGFTKPVLYVNVKVSMQGPWHASMSQVKSSHYYLYCTFKNHRSRPKVLSSWGRWINTSFNTGIHS